MRYVNYLGKASHKAYVFEAEGEREPMLQPYFSHLFFFISARPETRSVLE